VSETINLSDSLLIQRLDAEGTVLGMQKSHRRRHPMALVLDELSGIDVVSACEEQLGKLRAMWVNASGDFRLD
jgi:hypothetical protein